MKENSSLRTERKFEKLPNIAERGLFIMSLSKCVKNEKIEDEMSARVTKNSFWTSFALCLPLLYMRLRSSSGTEGLGLVTASPRVLSLFMDFFRMKVINDVGKMLN